MNNTQYTIQLPEGVFTIDALTFNKTDRQTLKNIYTDWRNLCTQLNAVGARGVNLPEGLSESAFCLEMGAVRVTSSISGANSSWDCYDIKRQKRIQVKACSVLPDLTSFGPNSQWDEIYFVDFYRQGNWDGTFDIYQINTSDIYSHKVNQNQTFKQQQQQGRRPRFSIYKELIQKQGIKPVKTGRL